MIHHTSFHSFIFRQCLYSWQTVFYMHIFIVITPFICPYETSWEMLNVMKFDSGNLLAWLFVDEFCVLLKLGKISILLHEDWYVSLCTHLKHKSVPWWASNPDTWTGYEITCFMLNLFIPSPLCAILPVPEIGPLPLTLVVSFEPSTSNSWAGKCHAATTRVHILGYYRFKIWKYGECNKYVTLFRSEQEFGVSRYICEQIVYVVCTPVGFIK